MVIKVEAIYDGGTYTLTKDEQSGLYAADIEALKKKIKSNEKYSYYPIILRATDDGGNVTVKTITDSMFGNDLLLKVREEDLFPLNFISATPAGIEKGYVSNANSIDLDLGDTNDFVVELRADAWNPEYIDYGYLFYVPGTEYGGIIEDRATSTKLNTVTWYGYTWRGLLGLKIIQPPDGSDHLVVSGEANRIIRQIIGNRFDSLFVADDENSGISVKSYKFDRYTTVLAGLEKMLLAQNARLKICYEQGEGIEPGAVHLSAVPITDWSSNLEYSQDGYMQFSTRDYRRGVNHLICVGSGEGTERLVVHLYVQSDGSIGNKKYYYGLDEKEALYEFNSVNEADKLMEYGMSRLRELMNYKQFNADVENIEVDIGDIVGGRDHITGMEAKLPITGKIIRVRDGTVNIEHKIKGDE